MVMRRRLDFVSIEQEDGFRALVERVMAVGPPAWTEDAVCAQSDPDAFFPERGGSTKAAKLMCKGCPVTTQCLDYALDNEERHGVWGGLSERERRKITTARHRSATWLYRVA